MGENTLLMDSILNSMVFSKPLGSISSFNTGGKAYAYYQPDSYKNLCEIIEYCNIKGLSYKIIGNCTNILVSDAGYNGVIISLKKFSDIKLLKSGEVKVGAGANLSLLIDFCIKNGLSGLEYLAGIPATVGGAITMNAGAFLSCISDHITVVETIKKNKFYRVDKSSCKFSYRNSKFLHSKEVVVACKFLLNKDAPENIKKRALDCQNTRKTFQPLGRTCGSVFKNPKGYHAGELIERAHLKGYKIGGASVSEKHANFIVANEGCTSLDIKKLISFIKMEVYSKFNVKLNEEIEYLGDF